MASSCGATVSPARALSSDHLPLGTLWVHRRPPIPPTAQCASRSPCPPCPPPTLSTACSIQQNHRLLRVHLSRYFSTSLFPLHFTVPIFRSPQPPTISLNIHDIHIQQFHASQKDKKALLHITILYLFNTHTHFYSHNVHRLGGFHCLCFKTAIIPQSSAHPHKTTALPPHNADSRTHSASPNQQNGTASPTSNHDDISTHLRHTPTDS